MQTSSIVTGVVNNFLIGDIYISVRNEQGTEITQIHPVRIEEVYVHSWAHDNTEDYMCSNSVYCKFKLNNRLTHSMNLEVFPSLFGSNLTFHLMPYNFQVTFPEMRTDRPHWRVVVKLKNFILHTFPDISKTTVHNYEQLKTGETVGIKRKREE
jgi:hypothetical protein